MFLLTVVFAAIAFRQSFIAAQKQTYECNPGEVPSELFNNDGYLKLTCQFTGCEDTMREPPTCLPGYRNRCSPTEFVGGIQRVPMKNGNNTSVMYLVKCCTHRVLTTQTMGLTPQPFEVMKKFVAALTSSSEHFDYLANIYPDPARRRDHYSIQINRVRCKQSTTSTSTVTATPRKRPQEVPVPVVVVPNSGDNSNSNNQQTNNQQPFSDSTVCDQGQTSRSVQQLKQQFASQGKITNKLSSQLCREGTGSCIRECSNLLQDRFITGFCAEDPDNDCVKTCGCIGRDNSQSNQGVQRGGEERPHSEAAAAGVGAGCFSADVTTQTRSGVKRMADLTLHDEVLVTLSSGLKAWQRVDWFLHRDENLLAEFVTLETEGNYTLTLSQRHLVPLLPCDLLIPAADVEALIHKYSKFASRAVVGNCLLTSHPKGPMLRRIVGVETVWKTGVYSPVTASGHLIANDVYVSCFAGFESHALLRSLSWLLSKLYYLAVAPLDVIGFADVPFILKSLHLFAQTAWDL